MARIQGKTATNDDHYFAGIDVSKAGLDLFFANRAYRFDNTPTGHDKLIAQLGNHPCLITLEPTSWYHFAIWRALVGAGHSVAPVNPLHARRFAESCGHLAKTDRIDAAVLERISRERRPVPKQPPSVKQLRLKGLSAARTDLVARRATVKTHVSEAEDPILIEIGRAQITSLTLDIARVEQAITSLIDADPTRARTVEILKSIPGIATTSAHRILIDFPEIGTLTSAQAGALIGAAPMAAESGQRVGYRRTRGGRRGLQAALYMPAIVATTRNPDFKALKDRLKARGKHFKLILTAIIRKIIVLANSLVANDRIWKTKMP